MSNVFETLKYEAVNNNDKNFKFLVTNIFRGEFFQSTAERREN